MDALLPPESASRLPGRPIAIIDIGSNSVRLVIYEGGGRAPAPLYNEKLMCGLGRDLATTGRLSDDAVERALAALARFRVLCHSAGVGSVRVLATAAARMAANGADFLRRAAEACGCAVTLLTGEREAELSALGVISGFHEPDGIVGDLGGGSLELIEVRRNAFGSGKTLPLGGLVLKDRAAGSAKVAAKLARDELLQAPQLHMLAGRTFYAVGGTWRALAKMQMAESGYPMHVMHGYAFELKRGGFLRMVERTSPVALKAIGAVTEQRRPLLAYGALVLDEIVGIGRPAEIRISALGVREGLLYEELPPAEREKDPLLAASADVNRMRSRSPRHGEELIAWTDAFMASLGREETAPERRLRHAACLLADFGWRAHPDYRGEHSLALIAHATLLGIDHPGRAYLALAVYFRHEGLSVERASEPLAFIAGPRLLDMARLQAAMMRVAYAITAGMAEVLPRATLDLRDGTVVLTLSPEFGALASERLANRMRALGRVVGRDTAIAVA